MVRDIPSPQMSFDCTTSIYSFRLDILDISGVEILEKTTTKMLEIDK